MFAGTIAQADGGRLCVSERAGPWSVAVFEARSNSAPTPVDFSVLVQSADAGTVATDLTIEVLARHRETGRQVTEPATTAAATNKLCYAATCDLQPPGEWQVAVTIRNPAGDAQTVRFACRISHAALSGSTEVLWISWPLVPIALFVVHQWLAGRQSSVQP